MPEIPREIAADDLLYQFVLDLLPCVKLLSMGTATVMGNTVPAVLVRTLYGQEIVWGTFNVDRGKYKGNRLTNNAATEDVVYKEGFE